MTTYGQGPYGIGEYGRTDLMAVTPPEQTPRAPADMRIRVYDPNGDTVGLLPAPTDIQAQFALNDVSALSLSYPLSAPRAALLGTPRELAVEVTWDGGQSWNEVPSGRFQYLRDEGDGTKPGEAYKITGLAILKRLEKAHVGFDVLDDQGKRQFVQETPGAILAALWDTAVARGLLVGMNRTWTATNDSNGIPWPEAQSIAYDPSTTLLAALTAMAEQGWLDFQTQGRSVQAYVPDHPDGMGKDQTIGALPVTLRYGRDLTEAPFRRTWEALADRALVQGDSGAFVTRTNPNAITPWGPQETYATASGVQDAGTLNAIGDGALTFSERERVEHTMGLEFGATPHLPFRDYLPGHWVWASTDSTQAPVRMRLRAITLTRDGEGTLGGNVTLNDKFLEADILQNRRLTKLTQGAVQAGTGTTPSGIGSDILAPGQVTGLAASSAAYVEQDGRVMSQVTVQWLDVTTNADGTPASDVAGYEVWFRLPGVNDWTKKADTTASEFYDSPYDPGLVLEFKVRAYDQSYNMGQFSATATTTTASDLVPPPAPSAPTATTRLGTARITWNGLDAQGDDMRLTVPDFRYVDVHLSTVTGFTPTDATRVGELSAPGYVVAGPLNYQATYYARLVAYDSSGNASDPSAQVEVVVAPLVDVSNFPDDAMEDLYARTGHFITLTADNFSANLIEGSWVKAGTLTGDKLTIGAQGGQNVAVNGYMEDLNDAGTHPRNWSLVYQNGPQPTYAMEEASPISGRRSFRLNGIAVDNGSSWMNQYPDPGYLPVVAGQKWYIRGVFRPSKALAQTGRFGIRFQTAKAPSNPDGIFDSNVVWQGVSVGSVTGAGNYVLEGTYTVPTDHTKLRLGFHVEGDSGGVYDLIVDSLEMWPAATDSQITEVGAGKIRTGILQATERVVAGSLTGARAELNGVGFQSFRSDGIKMFEVQASTGDTYVGDSGGAHLRLGAYNSAWGIGSGVTQGLIQFRKPGTNDGAIYSNYWINDHADHANFGQGAHWSALRMHSPTTTGAVPAYLDLRSSELGGSRFHLEAQQAHFTANTWVMGGPANTVDFRLGGQATGWTFTDFSTTSRLNIYNDVGQVRLRSGNNAGAAQKMVLNASEIELLTGGASQYIGIQGASVGIRHYGQNVGFGYERGRLVVATFLHNAHAGIEASSFQVNSDPRLKDNAERVSGALAVVRTVPAYDYDMVGVLPRKSHPLKEGEQHEPQANRARGLMADELQALLPDAVHEDEKGFLSVSLYDVTATLWAAVRELAAEVATLKATPPAARK